MPTPRERQLFEILVRENAAMLTTYLRAAVYDSAAVDDLFQETMLVAWRRLGECDQSRPFGPWLRGIARNLVLAHHRTRKAAGVTCDEAALERLEQQVQHIAQRTGDTWEDKTDQLHRCIGSLPDLYRQPIELRYLREREPDSVAAELGLTLEALKKRLQRARSLLLECLQRHDVITGAQP
jgi:RNA polymerase sigma-70 factor (ECF subfamily)